MANGVIVHSNQLSRIGVNRQTLKNGSSVLVRVIADKGNGQYTGSVAGVRVNLKSNQNLKIGSTFVATIAQKNGTIYVSPKESFISAENFKLTALDNNQILSLLQNLGVPLDEISLNLLKQFKQIEMKLDSELLNKLHTLSLRFKGTEKSASEILTILTEKKLTWTEEEIFQLLELLVGNQSCLDEKFNSGKNLLNKINKEKGSWFIVPFEVIEIKNQNIIGKGNIRLLLDKIESVKLINLECFVFNKRFVFSLSLDKSHLSKIRFNIDDNSSERFVLLMKNKFPSVDIEWAEIENLEGSSSNSEEVFSYNGVV